MEVVQDSPNAGSRDDWSLAGAGGARIWLVGVDRIVGCVITYI